MILKWAINWLNSLDKDERETVEERIAIQMESNGWSEGDCLINLYKESREQWKK
jgi:hypothetical protein